MQLTDLLSPNLNLTRVLAQAEKTQANLNAIVVDRQAKVETLEDDIKTIKSIQEVLAAEGGKAARIAKRFKAFLD